MTRPGALPVDLPAFVREIVEEIAFQARRDQHVDRRSGVSQRLPDHDAREAWSRTPRRRHSCTGEADRRAACQRHLRGLAGADRQDRTGIRGRTQGRRSRRRARLVRQAVATVFDGYAVPSINAPSSAWFNDGGTLDLADTSSADALVEAGRRHSWIRRGGHRSRVWSRRAAAPGGRRCATSSSKASARCAASAAPTTAACSAPLQPALKGRPVQGHAASTRCSSDDDEEPAAQGKKKYYN